MKNQFPFIYNRLVLVHIALLVALIGSAVYVTPAQADVNILVNSDQDPTDLSVNDGLCTLREAITNANDDAATYPDCAAGSGADTITFAGDYIITLQNRELPFITSEMTIKGNGADKTVIQASTCNPVTLPGGCTPATYRVFHVLSSGNLTLDSVNVGNGNCQSSCSAESFGGAIRVTGKLTVVNSSFSGNSASIGGGAIWVNPGPLNYNNSGLTVINSTFSGNQADYFGAGGGGGAILVGSGTRDLTITGSTFSGNLAFLNGGGIKIMERGKGATLTNNIFRGNSSSIFIGSSSLTVEDSQFLNNGEGIHVGRFSGLTVNNSTFSGSSHGIYVEKESFLRVEKSTFSGNTDSAIYSDRGNVTVTDSTFSGNSATAGGAIYSASTLDAGLSGLTITNSIFIDNKAELGGAIYSNYKLNTTVTTITDSTFTNNSATGNGGGIYTSRSNIDVKSSKFTGNSAANGGAIYSTNVASAPIALLNVADSSFSGNSATQEAGGGISLYDHADLSVSKSVFSGNSATTTGGGISTILGGRLSLTDSTLSGNTAGSGGGLYFELSKKVDVISSTFSGNSATTLGGGIHGSQSARPSIPMIVNSTISENTADLGGGLALFKTTLEATNSTFYRNSATTAGGGIRIESSDVTLTNTIVANSLSGDSCAGGIKDGGHNLDSGTSCKWVAGSQSLKNTDPKLDAALANNGGSTQTLALLEGSPAMNAGDDAVCFASPVDSIDQRGMARQQGSHCDIGAYEAEYFPVISGNVGVAGVSLSYLEGTLKTVKADSKGNYSIRFSVGWSGTITPSKVGYTFTPANNNYSNLQSDQIGEDYTVQHTGGADNTGVFRPSNGLLYLKNKNESGFADIALNYGMGGDYPITGDWDGDGTDTIGVYRDGTFYLRNSNTNGFAEIVFSFGQAGDQPIAGDWDGDGVDTVGVVGNGTFYLRNSNDAGAPDATFGLGNPGDVGIAGDWNGDGIDTTGVFRPSDGLLYLKNSNDTGFADLALNYGLPGDRPVTGDWDNDGTDTIGVYRAGTFYLRNENTNGFAQLIFALGDPGDMPIAGNWDGVP
jgi:predicted outer membrane repeat protein